MQLAVQALEQGTDVSKRRCGPSFIRPAQDRFDAGPEHRELGALLGCRRLAAAQQDGRERNAACADGCAQSLVRDADQSITPRPRQPSSMNTRRSAALKPCSGS
jgi:hypothetical protein